MATPFVELTISASTTTPVLTASISRAAGARAAEPTDASPYSFLFTGRHDGGALAAPADGSHYALLLDAIAEAKACADAALAPAIAAEADAAKEASTNSGAKKPRVDGALQ